MSLPHAILGFLQVMPMTGYDLKTQAFDRTVAHFWGAVQQQIYRELEKMESVGWVECEVIQQTDKPPRKVYRPTAAGRAEFDAWLKQSQTPPQHREAFLIQLFFAAQLTDEEIRIMLLDQREAHQARKAELEKIVMPPPADAYEKRKQALIGLTLDLGLRLEQMYIEWLTDALETVSQLPSG